MAKKLFWSLCCILCLAACSDDDDVKDPTPVEVPKSISEVLIGEWVADYAVDSPEGYSWEIVKFEESGVMYFSNYSEKDSIRHDYVNGSYSIKDSTISTNCQLGLSNLYKTENTDIKILSYNDYEFNAELHVTGSIGKKKINSIYRKVVDKIEIERGDTLPDYDKLFKGRIIKSFKSHNPYITTVDAHTGRIKCEWAGSTYIDVETDAGTAVVQVDVNNLLYYDYASFINKPLEEVEKVLKYDYMDDDGYMFFLYDFYPNLQKKANNWKWMIMLANPLSNKVDQISMQAKEDVWFTNYQMDDFLSDHYTLLLNKESSDEKYKVWYLGETKEEAEVGLTWDFDQKGLTFMNVKNLLYIEIGNEDYLPDYNKLFGDEKIVKYLSREPEIATVDEKTGVITGINNGFTTIYAMTDKGSTATIQVRVKIFLAYDFGCLIGKGYKDVKDVLKKGSLGIDKSGDDDQSREFVSGGYFESRYQKNWEKIIMKLNDKYYSSNAKVYSIVLVAEDDTWFTAEEMTDYLSQKYVPFKEETSDTKKVFVNDSSIEKATFKVIWNTSEKVLTFEKIDQPESFFDYGSLIGQTLSQIETIMGASGDEYKEKYYFYPDSKLVDFFAVSFKSANGEVKDTAQNVTVCFKDQISYDDIVKMLDNIYILDKNSSSDDDRIYYSKEKTIKLRLVIKNGVLICDNLSY